MIARYSKKLLFKSEQEIMGLDHAKIGGLLLKKWQLPLALENIIKYHHSPESSNDPLEPGIVHLADIITNADGFGSSGERFVPALIPDAWDSIHLSPNVISLSLNQMDRQVEEIIQFIFKDG